MPIGKKAGSMDRLKKELKSGGGDDRWFWRIQADDEVKVRFLAEPYEFTNFNQHFDETRPKGKKAYPCTGDSSCVGCEEGLDKRKTWVAPVLDVNDSRVRVLQVPKTIVDSLYTRADRYSTIMDRDVIILRDGSTMDNTSYEPDYQDKLRRNLKPYMEAVPDIEEMLQNQLDEAMSDDDDTTSDRRRPAKKVARKTGGTRKSSRAFDDPDDDDDEPRRPIKRSGGAVKASKKVVGSSRGIKRSLRRTDDDEDVPRTTRRASKRSLRRD